MHVVFRTDASIQIGTGHVMRCLTLADALTVKGAKCEFICREHHGHLTNKIVDKGYVVHSLPMRCEADADLAHSKWLGATQAQDIHDCASIVNKLQPDWLVVDHYALDVRWESALLPHYRKLMAIDDLADRPHACQVLLDQTFGRVVADYRQQVPSDCILLCGSNYALLRPEFAALRPYSLQRRIHPRLKHLLINLGGVDKDNVTSKVLAAIRNCPLPEECEITVVMGATAPWLTGVQQQAQDMPWPTSVRVGVGHMAQLMAESDLAIGAAGATSWERCCMGLPTIMVVLAENQMVVADGLAAVGAAQMISLNSDVMDRLPHLLGALLAATPELGRMSVAASTIVDGAGVNAVITQLGA